MSVIVRCALLCLTAASAVFATTAPFQVYVGYADSLRPSGFFPNPFAGAPGVVYSGQNPASAALDSGAIRIDNTGSGSLTISDLTVTLDAATSPVTFAIWSTPVTISAGQKAIFAQTVQYNFDSSDYGFLGAGPVGIDASHPLGGCTNPAALSAVQQAECTSDAPIVSFTENGKTMSYTDTGNVLDTFGYDFINGSSDGNESINWNTIGSTPSRGGNAPEPSSLLLLGSGLLLGGLYWKRRS